MKYLKLIKLLYLADREALSRWSRPITTDNYVSMDNGPVLSQVLKRIDDGAAPGEPTFWTSHIVPCGDWDVILTADPSDGQLSKAEERVLDKIFEQFGHRNRWDIVKFVHTLPEWQDPSGSAIPIDYRDILKALKKPDEEIAAIEAELAELNQVESFMIAS
ncbi:MAG: Panacea domain-containing protein [Bryobacteraceae bacterium]